MPAWADSADDRADRLVAQLTLDEKLQLVHGWAVCGIPIGGPTAGLRGAGFIPGVPRLGIPDFNSNDGPAGIGNCGGRPNGAGTVLPASIAMAASWDLDLAFDYGRLIGTEQRRQGFNEWYGAAIGLAREPRNGRTFEYHGEDPLLSGKMLVPKIRGAQRPGLIATLKHYAGNQQETNRQTSSSNIDERTLRELYLLHFEIAVKESGVGSVMCSYNKLNGVYACENDHLMNDILKGEWGFPGFVISDFGATHSTVLAANSGLDEEQFRGQFFGDALKAAVVSGEVPMARLDDMVRRKLRSAIVAGLIGSPPPVIQPLDFAAGKQVAQRVAEQSIVLLKNQHDTLPLNARRARSIAVIGSHADVAVLTGSGSGQVLPPEGPAVPPTCDLVGPGPSHWCQVWIPSSPLNAIRALAPHARVEFNDGADPAAAAALAARSDVAIVFANQWELEGVDLQTLHLPDNQDELISRVAAAGARTIVVLEHGSPVVMPWIRDVDAVLATWYPGIGGGEAIANILFGEVNPSGKLPITFPRTEADLPTGPNPPDPAALEVNYTEGLLIGYRWFDARNIEPLFPFGHGLSYTRFAYSHLQVTPVAGDGDRGLWVSFDVKNTGERTGAEVAQVYLKLPDSTGEPPRRLAGWDKLSLRPGQTRRVRVKLAPERLAYWNVATGDWAIAAGPYQISVGASSRDLRLHDDVHIGRRR
ncbi:MAG TPA: glycoside hydrolase family 3 C-terminal domain-containing protein [Kofleriaceae bacterium]